MSSISRAGSWKPSTGLTKPYLLIQEVELGILGRSGKARVCGVFCFFVFFGGGSICQSGGKCFSILIIILTILELIC